MKTTHKTGLLFGISGIIIMLVNYINHLYLFIFIGTIMVFIGIVIPIFFEDKKENKQSEKNRKLSK